MTALPVDFRRNTLSNYLTTLSSIVVALLTVPLLTSGLGPDRYGVWVLVGSAVLYLELLEFGFGSNTIKQVAAARARGDDAGVRVAVVTSFWLLSVPGALALAVGGALAVAFPVLFDVDPALEDATRLLLAVLAVELAISIPGDVFGAALIAHQRFDLLNATLVSITLLQAGSWVVVLANGGGLVELGLVTAALGLVGQAWRYVLVRRLVPGLTMRPRSVDRSLLRPYAGVSVWFAVGELSNVVINRVDTIVVGAVVGVRAAGVYAVGQKLALLGERVVGPALAVLFPHAAHLAEQEDRDGLRRSAIAGTRISTAVALPLCLVLVVLSGPAIEVWVGDSYAAAADVVLWLSLATAVTSLGAALQLMLYGMGAVRGTALLAIGEAALNLVLSIVLGRSSGLVGVAQATLIAAAVTTVLGLIPLACRVIGLSQLELYASLLRTHLLPALAAGAVGVALLRLGASGLLPLLGAAAVVGATYLGVLWVTGLAAEERAAVVAAVRRARERS